VFGANVLERSNEQSVPEHREQRRDVYLNHLNADESIKGFLELGRDVAVIHKMDTDFVLKTSCLDSLLCKFFLLDR
jgi:hypothetical protein